MRRAPGLVMGRDRAFRAVTAVRRVVSSPGLRSWAPPLAGQHFSPGWWAMTSELIARRRIRPRAPRCRGVLRASVEILEARWLPAGTVPSGIYTENFHLKTNPSQPGFDVGEAFTEEFSYIGVDNKGVFRSVDETIVNPNQVMGSLRDGWSLQTDPNDPSKNELELENGCLYKVTFPNLRPDVHVAAVSLDVDSSNAMVQISGQSSGSITHVQGGGKQHIFLGEQHVGPNGLETGPIREIL